MIRRAGVLDVDGRPARWVREGACDGRPLVLLAHGAGAPLDAPFLSCVATGLVERGACVTRFHFPYMERRARGGGRAPPDREPLLHATWSAMIARARRWRGARTLVIGGKSLGGRRAASWLAERTDAGRGAARAGAPAVSQAAARGGARLASRASGRPAGLAEPDVVGLVYLGYPLHPAGRPGTERAAPLARLGRPQLFVQGDRDRLCDLRRLRPVLRRLRPRPRLVVVAGGDHSLARGRRDEPGAAATWLDAVFAFVTEVSGA